MYLKHLKSNKVFNKNKRIAVVNDVKGRVKIEQRGGQVCNITLVSYTGEK